MLPVISYQEGNLTNEEQALVNAGFEQHSKSQKAPSYNPKKIHWKITEGNHLIAVLTANQLWDWLYIDELWVDDAFRNKGYGKELIHKAETYCSECGLAGIWLWTQSWQAANFYQKMEFKEFAVFDNFPQGHQRIGFRKEL